MISCTWEELAKALNVQLNDDGSIPTQEFVNACLDFDNTAAHLPVEKRLRFYWFAIDAMEAIFSEQSGH
tara:strand:+ start:1930 stop:2136 length:207 start_codon:yes stop_codon:yes gene_type:complete